ncbi:MAG: PBP1A family penicillin-binding protein [Candidatus Babeliales bacterium]
MLHNQNIDVDRLAHYQLSKPSILLDCKGAEWARFQIDWREPVRIEDIPQHVIDAFIAAEDWTFFTHTGVSVKGIIRSLLVNLYYGGKLHGASTITQQLVRLIYFDHQKTFTRKIKEQLMAFFIEQKLSKDQILQAYLNNVYLGSGIYGVNAACDRFWSKKIRDISIDEAATLAAIVKSPANYCPLLCPLSAQRRRNIILGTMYKLGFITQEQCSQAQQKAVYVRIASAEFKEILAPHFKETVRQFVEDLVGRDALYTGGLTIATTLDSAMQRVAQSQFQKHLRRIRKELCAKADGALVTMDVKTGGIRALIGGYDFEQSQFNRALQARRQMGSIFKPIVYAAAISRGKTFADMEVDEPIKVYQNQSVWFPQNNTRQFEGSMTIARALSLSNNIIAVKTLLQVGILPTIKLAEKFRISGPCNPYPSLALGCVDITLVEAVGAFNVFAHDGMYVEPHMVSWVKDQWGNKIWKKKAVSERIIASRVAHQVAHVLSIGIERFKKRMELSWFTAQAIGKTGTTNDSRTCWFSGSTPELTTSIYIGRDDNKTLGNNVYAMRTAFPIWVGMNRVLGLKKSTFTFDPSLRSVAINWKTGEEMQGDEDEATTLLV